MKNKNEHPIIFSTEMVQAILEGRKTQTRRIVKISDEYLNNIPDKSTIKWGWSAFTPDGYISLRSKVKTDNGHNYGEKFIKNPYGNKKGILWVRETWSHTDRPDCPAYRAGGDGWEDAHHLCKWKPSIHMPRIAARIFLEITNIRVERLQDISEEDAIAEGVTPFPQKFDDTADCWSDGKYKTAYEFLWNKINGWSPNAWQQNPWVWVIEFKKITDNGK